MSSIRLLVRSGLPPAGPTPASSRPRRCAGTRRAGSSPRRWRTAGQLLADSSAARRPPRGPGAARRAKSAPKWRGSFSRHVALSGPNASSSRVRNSVTTCSEVAPRRCSTSRDAFSRFCAQHLDARAGLLAVQHSGADLDRVGDDARGSSPASSRRGRARRRRVVDDEVVDDQAADERVDAGRAEGVAASMSWNVAGYARVQPGTSKAPRPSGSSVGRRARRPASARGPARAKSTSAATASGGPSNTASTVPSPQFRAQPETPRRSASRRTQSRKKTPCTRPWARTLRRTRTRPAGYRRRMTATLAGELEASGGAGAAPAHRHRAAARALVAALRHGRGELAKRARATRRPSRSRSRSTATCCSPPRRRPATLRADPEAAGEREWLLVAAVVGALVDLACPGPPATAATSRCARASSTGLPRARPLPARSSRPSSTSSPRWPSTSTGGIDRLRAAAHALPGGVLEPTACASRSAPGTRCGIAEASRPPGRRRADARSRSSRTPCSRSCDPGGERRRAPARGPRTRRGAWPGGSSSGSTAWASGAATTPTSRTSRAASRATTARSRRRWARRCWRRACSPEKPSVGQRHVFLNPRRAGDIRALDRPARRHRG